jgi:alkanesulfonate monooxygenase SsuD/methylene tetrahydromethanopterin reductase-like flavin-dependent oxidoreductase (luciferase family)
VTPKRVPLGVLDLVPISSGSNPPAAVRNSIDLARAADALGYVRYWFAEHHLDPGVAGSSPVVLIGTAAAATTNIRVGSGGVQSGHRTALSIVEEFGLLDALYPGRIDLGIRRSPPGAPHERLRASETDPVNGSPEGRRRRRAPYRTAEGLLIPDRPPARALPGSPLATLTSDLVRQRGAEPAGYGDLIGDVVGLLAGTWRSTGGMPARPVPGTGADLDLWVIGSGEEESAAVAGRLGVRFAANYHASPATVLEVIDAYRDAFVPSAGLDHPYVAVSANAVVGSDDRNANQLAEGYPLWVLSVRSGQGAMPFPSPDEARHHHWTEDERALVLDRAETQFVGSPSSVVSQLGWLQEATGADVLIVTTVTHRHEDRVRSYRLLAEEWMGGGDTGGRPPARMHYPSPRPSRPGQAPTPQHTR